MKIVNGIAYETTKTERLALKVLKYDLFNNESKYPDWNAGRLGTKEALQYMQVLYGNLYLNNPEIEVVPYNLETGEETVAISYWREASEYEDVQTHLDGKDLVYSTDIVGAWIPSNFKAIMAGYKLLGKHRKYAMLKKKYAKKLGVA